MRIEFTVALEGPTVSRRPGHFDNVDDREGLRLVGRGMAFPVDVDNKRLADPVFDDPEVERAWRDELAAVQAEAEDRAAETRPAPAGERAVQPPPRRTPKPATEKRG